MVEKLTSATRHILTSQTIDANAPGSVLRDFETLLSFLGEAGTTVSAKNQLLPMKTLAQLNASLTHPLDIKLKRPMQRSYPPINALYLLLRASGLAYVEGTGSTQRLVLDKMALASWQHLNPTERYFTLLETWLLRGNPEIIGEFGGIYRNPLVLWQQFFQRLPEKGQRIAGDRHAEESLAYLPGLVMVSMLALFGMIAIEHGKSQAGQGWCIAKMHRTPWGEALLQVLAGHLQDDAFLLMFLPGTGEESVARLHNMLQPLFPAWQHTLTLSEPTFHDGTYIFKVSLHRTLWRRIAIPGKHTLEQLSDAILASVDFDHDHLYEFSYKNRYGVMEEVHHPAMDEPPFTTEVRIGDVALPPGTSMTYVYDFGDHWEFDVKLERIDPVERRMRKYQIVESHGASPTQYPDWDEDEAED